MSFEINQLIKTDVVVLGGGAAGLRAAIEARHAGVEVCLVSPFKAGFGCNTAISHGGFAAVSPMAENEDSPQLHYEDTLLSGCGLSRPFIVRILIENIWSEVQKLEQMGVCFLKDSAGKYLRVSRGGHRYDRRLATPKNNGMNFILPILKYMRRMDVRELDGFKAVSLLISDRRVCGVLLINKEGAWAVIEAKAVVLATGGGGAIYNRTTNVRSAAGEGYALAYHAGLTLQDMEFVQFVVTPLEKVVGPLRMPPCETLLMRGAVLRNALGEDLFDALRVQRAYTRDVIGQLVQRGISDPSNCDNFVLLDVSTLSQSDLGVTEFPPGNTFKVSPCSHFFMGGVQVEGELTTTVAGLFAAGEVMGGVHGANRLGGNAIAEAFVFGAIAGRNSALYARKGVGPNPDVKRIARRDALGLLESFSLMEKDKFPEGNLLRIESDFKNVMSSHAGVIRDHCSLTRAVEKLCMLKRALLDLPVSCGKHLWQATSLLNMLLVGEMIVRSALKREESRGAHFRDDFPHRDDSLFMFSACAHKGQSGEMTIFR